MTGKYHDDPPPADQRITEIHAWIATYEDGSEGIVSSDLLLSIGPRHMPLMSSKRHVAEKLERVARNAVALADEQAGRQISCRLVTFRMVDG